MPRLLPCPACNGKVSEAAHSCPHCGHPVEVGQGRKGQSAESKSKSRRKPTRKRLGFVSKFLTALVLILIVGFFTGLIPFGSDEDRRDITAVDIADGTSTAEQIEADHDLDFEVLERTASDTRLKTMVSVRLLVPEENLNEEALRRTVMAAFEEVRSETGFEHRERANQIFIYAFASKAHAEQGGTNWVAMLEWREWEKGEPNVTVDTTRLASLKASGSTRFGLTTLQRKKAYKESFVAARKSREAADRLFPSPDDWRKNGEEQVRLQTELDAEIEKTFGITSDQREAIVGEGLKHRWPQ